jgi:type II secretory ATPase GspE/PulE/Tfp pilus assembly ATPase PilB-like protein
MLRSGADAAETELAALRGGMRTLRQAGLDKARTGDTSLAELARSLALAP